MEFRGQGLEPNLTDALVVAGRTAGRVAMANLDEAGSSRRLFAWDTYLRAITLAAPIIESAGYRTRYRGSALIGANGGHELQFATARGSDLTRRSSFDPFTSKLRKMAASINAGSNQLALPGLSEINPSLVIHVVWTFTQEAGLVAVHAGLLMPSARHGDVRWEGLTQVHGSSGAEDDLDAAQSTTAPDYRNQPEPEIPLAPRSEARRDAG